MARVRGEGIRISKLLRMSWNTFWFSNFWPRTQVCVSEYKEHELSQGHKRMWARYNTPMNLYPPHSPFKIDRGRACKNNILVSHHLQVQDHKWVQGYGWAWGCKWVQGHEQDVLASPPPMSVKSSNKFNSSCRVWVSLPPSTINSSLPPSKIW